MTLFDEAIEFAVRAHSGAVRRRESTPYILHPLEAATIVGTMTSDEDVLAAAVLHDTVEDTDVTIEQIAERFGERVAILVASETENKRPGQDKKATWHIRKTESLETLKTASDPGVKLLWLGDKLSNIRSFYRAWRISGNSLWRSFNQDDPAEQAWYYRSIDAQLSDLHDHDAWQEYHFLVELIFKGV
ncbi:MAG: bifunctional (p)ppGpp synthetase/guanosine-3',5'-bis(diphosphate) 3'-pyrophosphohydrolase [Oscillospiraceae bacterium]|nr:bifunctional (p)ppGpp synthetase/guanosine-3',5'-bis(diphosphate) 3'-pyrophosphohydrolase [Oscillospiraceae bacterium]